MARSSKQKNRPVAAAAANSDNDRHEGKRKRKSAPRESPQQRSSIHRGVTRSFFWIITVRFGEIQLVTCQNETIIAVFNGIVCSSILLESN